MALQVNYYFCLLSPWAYLGTARFETIAARHGAKVNYKPVKVRKVLDATGGVTLKKRSAQRRAYRMMELKRWRDHLEVPIVLEPRYEFPETDFIAARTVLAASREGGNPAGLVFGYLRAMWLEERDIADAATIRRIIAESGFDPDRLLEVAELPEIEETYERYTTDAVSENVFGVPAWTFEDGELFWGQDRLDFVDRAMSRRGGSSAPPRRRNP
jgi:2-hydroxychromene-2-carboxylate isomerase